MATAWNRSCYLIHWGRVTHTCVSKQTIIGSDNGLSPDRRQPIIWTNAGLLLIGPLGINFSEILIEILTFSFKKMCLKVSSAKRRPFCLGLNVLAPIIKLNPSTKSKCRKDIIHVLISARFVFIISIPTVTFLNAIYGDSSLGGNETLHVGLCVDFDNFVFRFLKSMRIRHPWWRHQMKTFSALLILCEGNHRSPVDSPHKGQWRGALILSFICTRTNRDAGDLRSHCAQYDVNVL